MEKQINTDQITRVEIITRHKGRECVKYGAFEFSIQDDGQTLKIFATEDTSRQKKWYVVVASDNRISDGFVGWDSSLHSREQIFSDDELPYNDSSPYVNVLVSEGVKAPSLLEAQKVLNKFLKSS